jgi:hypothetical protein
MTTSRPHDGPLRVTTPEVNAPNPAPSPAAPSVASTREARLDRWRGDDDSERLIALAVLGALIEVFLIMLTQRFWLTNWFPGPGVSVGFPQMMSGSWSADFRWISIVLAAPFGAFVPAIWYVRALHSRIAVAVVFGFSLLFGVTLLGLYPITAADLFHYLADARTLWVHFQNPMQVAPDAHPFIIGISWAQQPSPYGPFWQILSVIPVALTGGHYVAGVFGFKVMSMLFYLVSAALVYLTVRRTWPGRELTAALVYAWNPFIVFRVVGNGHNDVAMMAFALAAFYFVSRRMWLWALPLLALSVCIKYSTALIVPPVLLYAWLVSDVRQRRELVTGAGIAAALTLVVFLPFWKGFDTFKTFVQNTNLTITAFPQLISLKLQGGRSAADADQLVKQLGYVGVGIIYLALLYGVYRRPSFRTVVAACALVFIAYLVLCTWWFRPWYFIWFLSLTALLPSFWWTALAVATTFGATFFDAIEQYRQHWTWVWSDGFRAYAAPVASAFLPLIVVLIIALAATGTWTLLRERQRSESSA